jgi:hypothetical protein
VCTGNRPLCRRHSGRARSAESQAELGLIPLLERMDRDLLLEQCSRTCGGEAVPTRFALRTRASHPLSLRSWRVVGCGTHPRSGDAPASQALR